MSPCIFILTIDKLKFYCYINTLKINKSEVKMDKIYYMELFKFTCNKLKSEEAAAKKIFDVTLYLFDQTLKQGLLIKDKAYWVKANNFLLERYVSEVIHPDSEPEAYVEDLKERMQSKFDNIYNDLEKY